MFGIPENDRWLSWEETKFYAAMVGLPTVPELAVVHQPPDQLIFERDTLELTKGRATFEPHDVLSGQPATIEGIVLCGWGFKQILKLQ